MLNTAKCGDVHQLIKVRGVNVHWKMTRECTYHQNFDYNPIFTTFMSFKSIVLAIANFFDLSAETV